MLHMCFAHSSTFLLLGALVSRQSGYKNVSETRHACICVQLSTGFKKKAEHEISALVRNWNHVLSRGEWHLTTGEQWGTKEVQRRQWVQRYCAFTFDLHRSRQSTFEDCKCVKKKERGPEETYSMLLCDYIIITIVQSYTRKYHEFVPVCIVTSAHSRVTCSTWFRFLRDLQYWYGSSRDL